MGPFLLSASFFLSGLEHKRVFCAPFPIMDSLQTMWQTDGVLEPLTP